MTLSKSLITGHLNDATQIRFTLSAWDSELAEIVLSQSQTFDLVDGDIPDTCLIWQNQAGLRGTSWVVTAINRGADGFGALEQLGSIQVPEGASHALADLLEASSVITPGNTYNVLTQAEIEAFEADRQAAETAAAAAEADRILAETAAANAQSSALTCATWVVLSGLTGTTAGIGAEVLDSDTGSHTDPVVGGTVANAGRYTWSASPAGWKWISATGLAGKASISDLGLFNNAKSYVVARFVDAEQLVINTVGSIVDVTTRKIQKSEIVRPQLYIVARFGAAVSLTLTTAGVPIGGSGELGDGLTAFPTGDLVADIGAVDIRQAPGVVTGRNLDQLFLRRSSSVYTPLTFGPTPARLLSADITTGVASVRRGGSTQAVKWRTTAISAANVMHLMLVMGQSLGQAFIDTGVTEKIAPWRDPVADRAWQFRAGDGIQRGPRPLQVIPNSGNKNVQIDSAQLQYLEPLRGANHAYYDQNGQTTHETLAAALLGQHLDHRAHVLGACVGTGSTAISSFAPATAHYLSAQAVITAAAAQAAAMNCTLKVWLIWNQGEQDNTDGTAQATYEAAWIAIRDGLSAHTVSAGGTFGGALIQQCLLWGSGVPGMATLAHANLMLTGEAMGITPKPMAPGWSTAVHLLPLTYLPLGCSTAYEIARAIAAGSQVPPVRVAAGDAHLTTSTQIDCTISGGSGSYVFDTTTMVADPEGKYGVRVWDTSGEVTVSAVALTSATNLRITLAAPVLLANSPRVEFGLDGVSYQPLDASARVNIRDDSAWPCGATGQIVSGWMIHHKTAVVA